MNSTVKKTLKAVFLIILAAAYVSPAVVWLWVCRIDDRTKYIKVGGEPIGENSGKLRMFIQEKTAKLLSTSLTLSGNENIRSLPLESLGFVPDVKTTIEKIDRIREYRDDPIHEFQQVMQLRKGLFDVSLSILLDGEVAKESLIGLKDTMDTIPVNAKIGWNQGLQVIDEKPGYILDIYGAINTLEKKVIGKNNFSVELPFITVEPEITAAALNRFSLDAVIGEYTTKFSRGGKDNAKRAQNIEMASGYLDGTVIPPEYMISFNKIVGPRSIMSGFKEAPEIFEGEMIPGVGGGVCQVASTLHAAAFLGGLDIIEHHNHSRPSSYITMGLDATVAWPVLDLKIRNPFPFPVIVKAYVEKNKITAEIVGAARPLTVKWRKNILLRQPFEDSIEYDESLPVGEIVVEQKGIDGFKIKKIRKLIYQDGTEKIETEVEYYPPTLQMLRMSPDTEYTPVQEIEEDDIPENPYEE